MVGIHMSQLMMNNLCSLILRRDNRYIHGPISAVYCDQTPYRANSDDCLGLDQQVELRASLQ
eukprot:29090-Eustigmatos_ZCMA.PRE.1